MISVIIPTLDSERSAAEIIRRLAVQTVPVGEIIVIDSQSSDDTAQIFTQGGARVTEVRREAFHHAAVRNQGATLACGDFLVFMTQDAFPTDRYCLERLIAPLTQGRASASFARQIPLCDATPLERFARRTNYPEHSRIVDASDIANLGVRAFFFSNSFSAVRRETFDELGGFPEHTIMNEDMLFATKLLRSGKKIAYVAEATVEHSHDYTFAETLRRYFDIGVVFTQAREELGNVRLKGEGARYLGKLLTHLVRNGDYHWLPAAFAESAAKFVGISLGKRYRHLPFRWTRRMSMHPDYWSRRP